jgi:drug/metabolite transporter (DMT)-like permease
MGYASEEERKAKRGLEDWELVEKMPESQRAVPYWFLAVVVVVLLIGIGLAFPFWGVRPGYERPWLDWGFLIALVYIAVAGYFVYFMVNMYSGSKDHEGKE